MIGRRWSSSRTQVGRNNARHVPDDLLGRLGEQLIDIALGDLFTTDRYPDTKLALLHDAHVLAGDVFESKEYGQRGGR